MGKRVLLVDDNALMRQSLRKLFEAEPEFEVAGEAEDGSAAIDKAEKLKPHLIILDFAMPLMDGLEAAPHILRKVPTAFLILCTLYTGQIEAAALNVGIHAIVHKNQAGTHLIPSARALFDAERTDRVEFSYHGE